MKNILDLFTGLLTPIIAIITIYIAYQQHKTSKEKLKLDLYDKRFMVYCGLRKLFRFIIHEGSVTQEALMDFLVDTNESLFLFDKEVISYLEEVYQKAAGLLKNDVLLRANNIENDQRSSLADKNFELVTWFILELDLSRKKFEPYLKIKHH